jgi:hypothetical protein
VTTDKENQAKPTGSPENAVDMCPYWHQMAGDFASMYPSGGYCTAGCHEKVKVMAGKTVEDVCILKYGDCEGYQRVRTEDEAKEHKTPDTRRR